MRFLFNRETRKKLFNFPLVGRMLGYVRAYIPHMLVSLGLMVVMIFCANLLPFLIMYAIDHFLVSTTSLGADERMGGLWKIAGIYLAVAATGLTLRFFQAYLMAWIGQHVIFDIRAQLYKKIMNLPFAFFDRNPVGRLMTRVTSDVQAMQKALTDGTVALVADVIALFAIMGFMFYISPKLASMIFIVLPILFVIVTAINYRIRAAQREVRRQQSNLNAFLQEMITGMSTVQIFNREEHAQEQFEVLNQKLRAAFIDSLRWFSFFFPSVEILGAITTAFMLTLGGLLMLEGSSNVTAGVLVAFLLYIRDFFRPMEDLSEKSNNLQSAIASAERIFGVMDTPESIADPEQPEAITHFRGEVHFDQVSFAYQDEDWVLRDINLHVQPGESLAIVGATGAGKTTIASLLARFYDVQKGTIRVDGHDVRNLRQADLRRRIGFVLQDPFIFSETIAYNIGLNNPDLSREEIEQAARYVNAETFIQELPNGYDTVVHERGVELSTGQKQLLALARALAQNPDILLILDEATANVDTETEILIQDALTKLMHGRTSIIIAHRLSTIQHVNRILVMRAGEIVEQGSHQELVQQGGYYKRLYELLFHTADT